MGAHFGVYLIRIYSGFLQGSFQADKPPAGDLSGEELGMTTLTHAPHATTCGGSAGVATYNSERCTGRCEAKCYEAITGNCDCICRRHKHGAGVERTTENTRELAKEWLTTRKQAHSDTSYWAAPAGLTATSAGSLVKKHQHRPDVVGDTSARPRHPFCLRLKLANEQER
jgi:hypothetical protein